MDRVFLGLAGQPCQPLENPVHPSSFTWINPILPTGNTESLDVCTNTKKIKKIKKINIYVYCHLSHVMCHKTFFTCLISPVTWFAKNPPPKKKKFKSQKLPKNFQKRVFLVLQFKRYTFWPQRGQTTHNIQADIATYRLNWPLVKI